MRSRLLSRIARFGIAVWSLGFASPIQPASAQDQNPRSQVEPKSNIARTGNPVFPGWYADPEGAVFGKKFWIFPTYSARYEQQTFFDAFSSADLVNWTKHSHVLGTNSVTWARRAMWAPSVVEKDGRYFFFFGANDIQNNQQTGGIGVAVADKPEGPYSDYLGKPLIDGFHNGAQPIDSPSTIRTANII